VRILHIADVHLERSFVWLGNQRGDRRRGELRATLARAIDLAIEHHVDALCIAGDLYDTEMVGDATGTFLKALFARLPVPVLISPGNHDPFHAGCLYDRVSWSGNVHIFRGPELTSVPVGDGQIWGRAFRGPRDDGSPLAGWHLPDGGLHLGLIHADIVAPGVSSPYAPLVPSDITASGLSHVMLGHIHAGRIDRASRYAYTGSIEPLDISEGGEHWALLVDASLSGMTVEPLPLARRRVISDHIDVTDVALLSQFQQIVAVRREAWQGNNLNLRIDGILGGELQSRPAAIGETLADFDVGLELAARPAIDVDALAAQQTTMGAFVRAAREGISGASTDEARRAAQDILAAGVAAFTGQEVFLG
jgi:exonuclease SbcD